MVNEQESKMNPKIDVKLRIGVLPMTLLLNTWIAAARSDGVPGGRKDNGATIRLGRN